MKTMKTIILIVSLALTVNAFAQNCVIADYRFNGDANDISGNGNHGTVNGATLTTDRFGNPNSAYTFDGVNDYIELTNSNLVLNGSFTFSTWVTIDDLTPAFPDPPIISQWQGNNSGERKFTFGYRSSGGAKGVAFYTVSPSNSQKDYYPSNWSPIQSDWYNLSVVFSPGISVMSYVNGQLHYEDTVNIPANLIASASPIRIGQFSQGGSGEWWNGKVDDIKIYQCALEPSQIDSIYQAESSPTGVPTPNDFNTLKIYPNPANTQLTVDNENFALLNNHKVLIKNSLGQQMFFSVINTQTFTIDISLWATGLYYVNVIDSGNQTIDVRKLVLQ